MHILLNVGGKNITADKILIATGGRPSRGDIPGNEHAVVSDDAFYLKDLPKNVLVVGGGYIAVEFAGIFNGYGADTTLVYRGEKILRGFDIDVRLHLAAEMEKKGVKFIWDSVIDRIDKKGKDLEVYFSNGSMAHYDQVLCAIGRIPNTSDLGLEQVGVKMNDNGAIMVDDFYRTSVENIYALGDIIDRYQLTPVAIGEAMKLASESFQWNPRKDGLCGYSHGCFLRPTRWHGWANGGGCASEVWRYRSFSIDLSGAKRYADWFH